MGWIGRRHHEVSILRYKSLPALVVARPRATSSMVCLEGRQRRSRSRTFDRMCFSAQPNAQVRQPNVNRFSVVVRRREAPVRSGSGSRKHSKASVHWVRTRGAAMLSSHEPSRRERHNSHPSMPACQDAPRRRSPTCSLRDRSIAHLGRSLRGRGRLSAPCNHRIPLKRLSVERSTLAVTCSLRRVIR